MPKVYISPSTQEKNPYITGSGSEEYQMNKIADALVPYLLSCGIAYDRNTPEMTAGSSVRDANARGEYGLYLAIHSNASGDGKTEGKQRGIIAFYYPGSADGERAADLFVKNFEMIYPEKDRVYARSTTTLGEVRLPRFPSVLLEIGYHDNLTDAQWIESHTEQIARVIALSLTEYFGIPFIEPITPFAGRVNIAYGTLNLRSYPSTDSIRVADLPPEAEVMVYGVYGDWYVVHYNGLIGYAFADYIRRI